MDWVLYDNSLRHERVNYLSKLGNWCYHGSLEKTTSQAILSNYETWNIYNADEFELFYQTFSWKTPFKKERCVEGKYNK